MRRLHDDHWNVLRGQGDLRVGRVVGGDGRLYAGEGSEVVRQVALGHSRKVVVHDFIIRGGARGGESG